MSRKFKKCLCIFLSALFVIQILPMSVFGADVQNRSLPRIVSSENKEINIVQELTSENTDNQTAYLADDGSIVETITLSSDSINQVASFSTSSNSVDSQNSVGLITIYQEDDSDNESGIYTMDDCGISGIIADVNTANLGNVFVNDAYITIHCEAVDGTATIYSSLIMEDYGNYYSNIYTEEISDYVYVTSENNDSDITLDITKFLNLWLSGGDNYGICVYSNAVLTFSDASITINYRNISDVDTHIESEIINMGRAGVVYINDFNGAPTIVRNEIGLDGYLAPVQIQSILNPYNNSTSLIGSNFRINYESNIVFDGNSNCYILNTCEGEILNFTYSKIESTNKIYTATNSQNETCTLTVPISSSASIQDIKVKDADNYEYHFNSYGFLSEILVNGNNANKIVIAYTSFSDSNNNLQHRISSITDGSNRIYQFTYDANNRLSNITVKNNQDATLKIGNQDIFISYVYNNAGLLNKVTYPDGEEIEYTYDSNNRIDTIVSNSDNTLDLNYLSNEDLFMISEYTLYDSNDKQIENISFGYDEPYRRTLTNGIEKEASGQKVKILDFDKSYNLIYLEEFDNKNYFLDYENNTLKSVINDNPSKNVIINSEFSKNTSGWTKLTGTSASRASNTERRLRADAYALRITGSLSKDSGVYQEILGDFKEGDKYIIEAYLHAPDAVSLNNNKKMGIAVTTSKNTTGVPVHSDVISQMDYQPYISSWQLQKQIITIPEDTDKLYVYLYYGYMTGYCFFDSIKLYEYTEEDTSTAVDRTEYIYDSYGRLTKESVTEKTPVLGIVKTVKEKTYSYNGNNLTSVTDNGITTYYNYDSDNSLLMSYGASPISSSNIQYSYNGIGALESVNQVINQINNETNDGLTNMQINTSYAYEHDKITKITHNGFSYNLSYDGFGNISEVSINNTKLFEYNSQYYDMAALNRTSQISKITYGDGTSLLYQEYIDANYYNVLRIYETKQPNPTIESMSTGPTYEFKYDYDGTLVEYIDYVNNTISIWKDNIYAIYNASEDTEDEIYNVLLGTTELNDLTEVPIYQYSQDYSGIVLGQSYTQSNINIYDDSFSVLSTSTYSNITNTTTDTDRIYYGEKNIESSSDLTSLINGNDYSVVKTSTDGFGRTTESSIVSLLDAKGVKNIYSYKGLGSKKTTDLIEGYETYYGGIDTTNQEANDATSLLYRKYEYEYNSNGQITDVYLASRNLFDESTYIDNGNGTTLEKVQHYEYDELGQIIEEINLKTDKAILYYYDQGGNITEKRIYQNSSSDDGDDVTAFTFDTVSNELTLLQCTDDITYDYNHSSWKDLLTSYNGVNITYDDAGNPLNYSGTNIFNGTVEGTMEWKGKNLVSFTTQDGSTRYEYKYNADGLRTQKKILSAESDGSYTPNNAIDYIWDNDIITGYRITSYKSDGTVNTEISMKPIYDNNNNLMGIMYENPNAQDGEKSKITIPVLRDGLGNITDMYTAIDGSDTMFHFDYGAYGNCILNFSSMDFGFTGNLPIDIILGFIYIIVIAAITAGTIILTQQNYRGYLYDIETGLYYNQTRYYSPSWCRFINCDDVNVLTKDSGEILGANLFKYCDNDPVNYTDPSGFSKLSNLYDDSLLSLMGISSTEATKLNIAKTSTQNTVDNKIIEKSLALTPQQQEIWSEVFNEKSQTVFKSRGYNYLSSQLNSSGNDKTKMFNTKITTPYNTKTAKNN